jgi:hypothetical protein
MLDRQFNATRTSVFPSLAINSRLYSALLNRAVCRLSLRAGENGGCGPLFSCSQHLTR